ncbi:conserved hypothetical protein [Neospora caninum Liverpool]|uniref:Transmembrane protein n=1 Tax=Neospora caninum (strain Liverpool) TaxID=572307 RepID=F0V8X7_NEOCL|nr:conserved hypothetical protein [Neospora caninum Liverpool]CBZ50168.1 conserved hypothetical protein [Neospora caninum Liverpool]CEL64765.1 TPA: hypothetical protein BN1204_006440 [Neospora caninum Liverpool]|eukprot:XP_003880203.1 conserved hypothetical protein [Neospora caninum Liverpool]
MRDASHSDKNSGRGRHESLSHAKKAARLRGSSLSSSRSEEEEREEAKPGALDRRNDRAERSSAADSPADEMRDGLPASSARVATMRLPSSRDARDRLFSAFLEEDDDDEDAEVIIERNGRIRVHPHGHYDGDDFARHRNRYPLTSYLISDEERLRDERAELAELELLREIRRERRDRDIHRHRTETENAIQDAIQRILFEEEAHHPLHMYRSNRPFAGLQLTQDADDGTYSSSSGASVMSSPVGLMVGFTLGFVGILLISSLCCVIRAVYVKKKKEAMKKLLREKLGPEAGFDNEASPAGAEPIDVLAAEPVPGAEDGWVDFRVEQQTAPAEAAMMDVARLDTLQRSGSEVVDGAPERSGSEVVDGAPERSPSLPDEQRASKKTPKKKKNSEEEAAVVPTVNEKKEDKPKKKKKKDEFKKALSAKHHG